MQSHCYEFGLREPIRVLAVPVAVVAGFAAAMHASARFGWLPAPWPALDVDRTVLVHQAHAARTRQDATVLLLGDSSCLMDVCARTLSRAFGQPTLNLGTLSYVDLDTQALLLRSYLHANPGQVHTVVLLLHPETMRLAPVDSWQSRALRAMLEDRDYWPGDSAFDRLACVLGLDRFHNRLLARWLPRPLPGAWGRRYGFTTQLHRYLTAHRGSAVDPETKPASGRPEYRLAPELRPAAGQFRQAMPGQTRLLAGITPLPEDFAGVGYPQRYQSMLADWGAWLQADAVLTNLPATLPDHWFAQKTHLNQAGQRAYTHMLAAALRGTLSN
jgi:hypothetical protein